MRRGATTAGVALLLALLAGCARPAPELPVYWRAPEFALVSQTGDTVRTRDLAGSAWVASFIFTNCTSICPLITQRLLVLRDSLRAEGLLGRGVRLVSFSVDPARDTPTVLRTYASRLGGGATPREWTFLTGTPPDSVRAMIETGFKLTANLPDERVREGGNYQVMHSPRLLLVDGRGQVRGLYDSTVPDDMRRLRAELHALLAARPTSAARGTAR